MSKTKILLAAALTFTAAGAARATKARDFTGYIYVAGAYTPVYVPYDCPYSGYGCTYTTYNGYIYQVYQHSGLSYLPVRP